MTIQEKITFISGKAIEANSSILAWRCQNEKCATEYAEYVNGCPRCWVISPGKSISVRETARKLGLADVLWTIPMSKDIGMMGDGQFVVGLLKMIVGDTHVYWDLKEDDLILQEDKTIDFIYGLLK